MDTSGRRRENGSEAEQLDEVDPVFVRLVRELIHELGNHVTAVAWHAELLAMGEGDSHDERRVLGRLIASLRDLWELLREIHRRAQIVRDIHRVELGSFLSGSFRAALGDGILLEGWNGAGRVEVEADPFLLEQALYGLGEAISEALEGKGEVHADLEVSPPSVVLVLRYAGPPPRSSAVVVARRLLERGGGSLRSEGSKLLLRLPLPEEMESRCRRSVTRRQPRVLVVSSSEPVRGILRDLLEHEGCEVLEAADEDEALTLAEGSAPIELALLAPCVSEEQCRRLVEGLRRRRRGVKVVCIASRPAESVAEQVEGDVEYLPAPLTVSTVLHVLDRHLGRW